MNYVQLFIYSLIVPIYSKTIHLKKNPKYCFVIADMFKLRSWDCSLYRDDFNIKHVNEKSMIEWDKGRLCLRLADGNIYNGHAIYTSECNHNDNNQLFTIKDNTISNKDMCFDIAGGVERNDNHIFMWKCLYDSENQKFLFFDNPNEYQSIDTPPASVVTDSVVTDSVVTDSVVTDTNKNDDTCPDDSDQSCSSSVTIRVVSYNLFWWNLYGKRHGEGESASKLLEKENKLENIDVLGFQECEDIKRVINNANMKNYDTYNCDHALGIAYDITKWRLLDKNSIIVAEDNEVQYYGKRIACYVKLSNIKTNKKVLFVNHHGPLPVNTGGKHSGKRVSSNIMNIINTNTNDNEIAILVGDFNADKHSDTIKSLSNDKKLRHMFNSNSFGGVDHIFTTARNTNHKNKNLGTGGSDHEAISTTFTLQ